MREENDDMKTGQAGIDLIKKFEGCHLTAYKCPAGVWTIGYGHTGGVKEGQKISQAQAEAYLRADLEKYEKKVEKYAGTYRWSQNEFDAMISFAYNLGSIDKLTANGTRSKAVIVEKMLLYDKAGGKVLTGLTKRRQAEREMFLSGASVKGSRAEKGSTARSILKKGSRGADVTYIQQRLAAKGYGVGAIDGIFGQKTFEGVKAFQAEHGIGVDGIVGAKTWVALQ